MERPDEISVNVAAALLGITTRRFRQLAAEGFIVIHTRGKTTISSAVGGYIRSLRTASGSSATSESAARGHAAKAELIRSHTAKRKAALTVRAEAEAVIEEVADAAIRRLKSARLPAVAPAAGLRFGAEIAQACARIDAAKARALSALATGDLSELDGGGHG